jgi:hypothetical protein
MRTFRQLVTRAVLAAAVATVVASPAPARAQSQSDIAAYLVLIQTPQGGFAPLVSPAMLGTLPARGRLALRYGRVDLFEDATNNLALTALLPSGSRGSVSLTAGYWNPDCDGCDGHVVLGLGGDGRLGSTPIGSGPEAARLNVGLGGELGFAKPEEATFWSATVGLPVTLVASGEGFRIAPFLTPGFGFGYGTGGGLTESGTRFMLGGGIGLEAAGGLGINFGFQKVFIEGGRTTIGLNVGFGL